MSVFYMKHPKHGTKVATEEAEVEYDKKRGWVEFDPEKPEVKPAAAKQESKPVQASQAV